MRAVRWLVLKTGSWSQKNKTAFSAHIDHIKAGSGNQVSHAPCMSHRIIEVLNVIPAASCGWDKGHAYSTWAWICLTCFQLHAAASWMPRRLRRGCAAAVSPLGWENFNSIYPHETARNPIIYVILYMLHFIHPQIPPKKAQM